LLCVDIYGHVGTEDIQIISKYVKAIAGDNLGANAVSVASSVIPI